MSVPPDAAPIWAESMARGPRGPCQAAARRARGSCRARRPSRCSTSARAAGVSAAAGLRIAALDSRPRRISRYLRTASPTPGLLLVAQQRQVGVEQVVRRLALAGGRQAHHVAQHVGKGVAGVGAIGAALHLVVEEQAVVAAQDGDVAHRAVALEAAQRRDLLQPRPVLVLEHHARRQFLRRCGGSRRASSAPRRSAGSPAARTARRRRSPATACR